LPKPDKLLRCRPLKEVGASLSQLKKVVLLHPDPIVQKLPAKYCVCKQGVRLGGKKTDKMIQCAGCWDWFHFDCVQLKDDGDELDDDWECEWCLSKVDKGGYQRWKSGRKRPKKRHYTDTPRRNGGELGGDVPSNYSAPPSWDGKVKEVKELARRSAIKKRKLTEAVEQLVAEGGHHVVDAEGAAGLEMRPVDDGLVDELVGAGVVDEADYEVDA
jgi:hypothetical protein